MSSSATTSSEVSALGEYLDRARDRVDEALDSYLPEVDPDFAAACPARLAMAMRYSVLGGGKRLRPILCLMAAEACGGAGEAALPAACALEMIHTYSLIHDDLPAMDDDDLRRGRSTCHRAFDEATAILAGDGLLTLAFELVGARSGPGRPRCGAFRSWPSPRARRAWWPARWPTFRPKGAPNWRGARHGRTPANLDGARGDSPSQDRALLRAPLRMGAVIAEAPDSYLEALDRYGKAVGLAFQIVDDLLDVQGDETKLGKRVGKDSELGKWTYPRFLGVDGSRRRARQLADEAVAAIEPLGPDGHHLRSLALALLERDR